METSEAPLSLGRQIDRMAERDPDKSALEAGDATLTRIEIARRTNRMARSMADRGVRQGDLVTIALPNCAGFLEAVIACWKLGAVPQPASWRLPPLELEALIELANPSLIVAEPSIRSHRPTVSAAELLAASEDDGPLPDRISPIWKAPTSGGSTGRPKLILAGGPGLFTPQFSAAWDIRENDVCLMPGPLYHNGPFMTATIALAAGAKLVLMPRFEAETALAAIARHRVTWTYVVPTMMSRIWRLGPDVLRRYDVSSLRTVWHVGAPCPAWLKEAWLDWLGDDKILEMYAGTEGLAGTIITGGEWRKHKGSVGRAVFGEIKIVGPEGETLPPGVIGEVAMRRPQNMPPTYEYRGAQARSFGDGWESLGDFGSMDEEGYLYLADRGSDMILVGGANVYPAEVEAALEQFPDVQSSAVIGIPDEDMGNRVHAIIQADTAIDLDALRVHLAERLLPYKQPRSFEIVDHPLRDDAGKMRRSQLRAERIAQSRETPDRPV